MGSHFGITWGELTVGTSPIQLVQGLTTERFVTVSTLATNAGDVYVYSRTGAGQGNGLRLQPTEVPVTLDLRYDNSLLMVKATTDGNTVSFMTRGDVGN